MPKLWPLFPYECEMPAGLASMYSGSGWHSRTGSPPVVQFVGFLGRICLTPQDDKVFPLDDIQSFRKIYLIITNYWTQFSHTDVFKYCVIIPSAQRSCWGYNGFTPCVCQSVCLSVHLSCILCPLCSVYSSGQIHFIFIHLIKQLQKVYRV